MSSLDNTRRPRVDLSSLDNTRRPRVDIFNTREMRTMMLLSLPKLCGPPTAERDKLMMVWIIMNVRTSGRPSTEKPIVLLIG